MSVSEYLWQRCIYMNHSYEIVIYLRPFIHSFIHSLYLKKQNKQKKKKVNVVKLTKRKRKTALNFKELQTFGKLEHPLMHSHTYVLVRTHALTHTYACLCLYSHSRSHININVNIKICIDATSKVKHTFEPYIQNTESQEQSQSSI